MQYLVLLILFVCKQRRVADRTFHYSSIGATGRGQYRQMAPPSEREMKLKCLSVWLNFWQRLLKMKLVRLGLAVWGFFTRRQWGTTKNPHADQDLHRRGIEPRAAAVVGSLISKYINTGEPKESQLSIGKFKSFAHSYLTQTFPFPKFGVFKQQFFPRDKYWISL